MALYKRKTLKKVLATVSTLFLTVLFCISPCAVSGAYAAGSSDLSTQAVLSKSNFGTVKKVNNAYYIVDEFGNVIDTVSPTPGVDLDRYIGRQILVKDNLFAGLAESHQARGNTYLNKLRQYLWGIAPKPKVIKPDPVPEPIETPDDDDKPMPMHPMYGVFPPEPVKVNPVIPVDGEIPVPIHPMYGVFQPEPVKVNPAIPVDGEIPILIHPMYGIFPPEPVKVDPGIVVDGEIPIPVHPMYGVFPPEPVKIDPAIPVDGPIQPTSRVFPPLVSEKNIIKEKLPLRGKPTISPAAQQIAENGDKMDVIQKQGVDRAELTGKGIQIVPEIEQKKDILDQKK